MTTKRNRIGLGESVRIVDFLREKNIDTSLYRPEDLCALVETNTGVTLSQVQLRNIIKQTPGLEWNAIGSKNAEGKDRRRTAKMRLDDLEPKHDELAEKVAKLAEQVEHLSELAGKTSVRFERPEGTLSPLDSQSG